MFIWMPLFSHPALFSLELTKKFTQPCWLVVPMKTDDLQHRACPEITTSHKPPTYFQLPYLNTHYLSLNRWRSPFITKEIKTSEWNCLNFSSGHSSYSHVHNIFYIFLPISWKSNLSQAKDCVLLIYSSSPHPLPHCHSCSGMSRKKPKEFSLLKDLTLSKITWIYDVSISPCLSLLHRNMPI